MTPRPSIRLVAVDLDGTLLNDAKRVSAQTVEALKCLGSAGVRVVIASARPPRSVRHVYLELELDTLQINYNGALVWDEPRGAALFHRPMEPGVVRRIIDEARRRFPQVLVSCEILDRWCTDRFDDSYTTETGRLFRPDLVAPAKQFCVEPITKLMLLAEPAVVSELEGLVRAMPLPVTVIRGDPDLLQVTDASVSKGLALRLVCNRYDMPMDQVLAIGDAVNDVPMLEAAGVAVAMDNAHPAVKLAADWVAPSNNDHGVCAALRRYGLC